MGKNGQAVTMKDVAKAARVSVSTVSLALRDSPRIPEVTVSKIKSIASDMNYTPNIAGSSLRTAQPRILGLMANLSQELHYRYVQEIRLVSSELNYELIVEDTNELREASATIERLAQFRVQAIIAIDPSHEVINWERVNEKNIPFIAVGQRTLLTDADLIMADNAPAAEEIMDTFQKRGITSFNYLDGPPGFSAEARRDCLERSSRKRGIEMHVVPAGANLDSGFTAANLMPPAGALVCYNDQCAEGALVALAQKNLADDVLVIGFDDSRIARSKTFQLSSVSRNPRLVATIATDMAVARGGGYSGAPATLRVPSTLIER